MQHRIDKSVCQWHMRWRNRRRVGGKKTKIEREREKEWERDRARRKARKKDKNQHNSFPLISSVCNIKAITGCLCQRLWNNTLVSGGEVRWGRRRMVDGKLCDDPLHQLDLRLVAAVTHTRATDSKTVQPDFLPFFFFLFCFLTAHSRLVKYIWPGVGCDEQFDVYRRK